MRSRSLFRVGWHGIQLAAGRLRAIRGKARRRLAGGLGRLPDAFLLERLFPPHEGGDLDEMPRARVALESAKVAAVLCAAFVSALVIGAGQVAFGLLGVLVRPLESLLRRLYLVVRTLLDHYGGRVKDAVARGAHCDVWILPYVGTPVPRLGCPYVVIVHDLVHRHYPESFTPEHYRLLDATVRRITGAAAICACASRFILEMDLLGILGIPPERTRCVPHAVPRDILAAVPTPAAELRERLGIRGRYVIYPSAFRGYKNHRALIEAVAAIRGTGQDLELVFTGQLPAPAFVTQPVAMHGLKRHVHLVGQVSREDLAGLYRGAEATIVPTLYEQGSFPVLEAMSLGCPVACSRIPPLLEQHRDDPDAMVFFDPWSPADIVRAIEQLKERRAEYLRKQSAAFERMLSRTWGDVAADWLSVCREAVELDHLRRRGPEPAPELQAAVRAR